MGEAKPRVLLVEDDYELRQEYKHSLEVAGFVVEDIDDGCFVELRLQKHQFDIVISDTETQHVEGVDACRAAFSKGLLGDEILLIGMSEVDYKNDWRDLAHYFYEKSQITDLGEQIKSHYHNFQISDSWRHRLLPLRS